MTTGLRAQVRRMSLDDIAPHPRNPKTHDLDTLTDSIRRFGFVEPVVVDQRTGLNVSGHGRVEALVRMRDAGESPPPGIDSGWRVPVYAGWASEDDAEAEAALVALNRIGEAGGWDESALLDLLDRLSEVDDGLAGVGYGSEEIEALRRRLGEVEQPPPPEPKPWPHRAPAEVSVEVLAGDCIEVMAGMEADSADALVTDPPYGIGFMGRDWDTHERTEFETWCRRWGEQALRVVKPGGHLIAFGGTRTHHRLMAGIEDAGWEIRDCGVWLYRSGFPKSLDVSKAIDRAAGVERQVVGQGGSTCPFIARGEECRCPEEWEQPGRLAVRHVPETAPATDDAETWEGWGTALKPAIEPWVLARRPPAEPTIAANVQRWGTGALNIDACRAEMTDEDRERFLRGDAAWREMNEARTGGTRKDADVYGTFGIAESEPAEGGRWPANVVTLEDDDDLRHFRAAVGPVADYPKAGSDEKPWDDRSPGQRCLKCGKQRLQQAQSRCQCAEPEWDDGVVSTHANAEARDDELHPTVKPLDLMRHLVRLVTPPGGTVLDPFAGSGTTGEAAMIEGLDSVLIEREAAYRDLIDRRIARTRGDTGSE